MSNWTAAAEKAGLDAVVVSPLYVGYDIERNNDLAVVESQQNVLSLLVDLLRVASQWPELPRPPDGLGDNDDQALCNLGICSSGDQRIPARCVA